MSEYSRTSRPPLVPETPPAARAHKRKPTSARFTPQAIRDHDADFDDWTGKSSPSLFAKKLEAARDGDDEPEQIQMPIPRPASQKRKDRDVSGLVGDPFEPAPPAKAGKRSEKDAVGKEVVVLAKVRKAGRRRDDDDFLGGLLNGI